jgi:hypothetical protein
LWLLVVVREEPHMVVEEVLVRFLNQHPHQYQYQHIQLLLVLEELVEVLHMDQVCQTEELTVLILPGLVKLLQEVVLVLDRMMYHQHQRN